ncbi:type I restriction-modification system subunit M [Geodermatophilus sp. SYSU D01105]
MVLKKSDLYRSLWRSCDELRGGMDASQYKDYILTLLFVKYVSDKAEVDPDALMEIPDGGSFADIVALKGKKNIGEGIDTVIGKLAKANDLGGVIDVAFFNDDEKLGKGQEMVDRLSKLVAIFERLDFRSGRAGGDDLLGDAYEYLMRHFATESGKSKGQFYTPAEVSRVLAKVVGIGQDTKQYQSVYDPTCGSGSLLLKAADEAPNGLTVYGQEKDVATWALARMNMILHGYETADLEKGDTITSPGFTVNDRLKPHDFVVANPPFSSKSWSNGINPKKDKYERFEDGVPPAKNGDYAFLLHAIKSLKSTGKAAVILPHGVLFRGNAEATIRKNLLKRGLIKGIIGLPPNLFYGTGIPACIVVVDKESAVGRTGVFMIDASRGFIKDGNKNRLRSQDIHKIVDVFTRQMEEAGYSRLVPLAEIADKKNDYNLNISRYIDSSDPEDLQDLVAHLQGGIPDHDLDLLSHYWNAFPGLREQLFETDRPGYSRARVAPADVAGVIEANGEYQRLDRLIAARLDAWWAAHRTTLSGLKEGTPPKPVIGELSEHLLGAFVDVPLISRYDVYEQLMIYWGSVLQDDIYLVSTEGWAAAAAPRAPLVDKERKISEDADLVIGSGKSAQKYKMDLLPPGLVMRRYFAAEHAQVEQLQLALDAATQALEDFVEEHGVEGGLLEDVVNDKGKVTKSALTAQVRALRNESERADELEAAKQAADLLATETTAKNAHKDALTNLQKRTLAQYEQLTEDEIKGLVIDDKWFATIRASVSEVVRAAAYLLDARCEELVRRYDATLTQLNGRVDDLAARVEAVLQDMLGGRA